MIGTRVAHYELNERLGAGGMGEVYRARDTKLGRDVAVKVLPESFANDAERAARFEREAKVLAALNHPNIASIYGFEGGALIMELVEGESPKGPMPVENVRHIASQIAAGLEYAHDKGIIHRDLKPANIKITADGVVKLLDFGLAKAFSEPGSASTEDLSNSPTVSMATQVGVILGTAAYMAPEQAKGKNVDKRADIWAFGVVLFELLTGRQLFEGDDASEILAQVLTKVPDWEQAPGSVQPLLRACLEKDPRKRLRDIGDANRLWMEAKPVVPVARKTHRAWKVAAAVAAALLLPAAIVSFFHFRETPPRVPVVISTLLPPENTTFDFGVGSGLFVLSPDGTKLVMTARGAGNTQLWLKSLDSVTARPLPGTEGATFPFWAPDSRNLGFFADQRLKRIDTTGGPPVTVCEAPVGRGGTWNRDNIIVFAPSNNEPLQSIAVAGGPAKAVTTYLPDDGPQRLPWFLPDGQHFLYRVQTAPKTAIRIGSLKDMNYKVVGPASSNAIYSRGYLLFRREGTLMAQAFDLEQLATTREAVSIAENVLASTAAGLFSASETGLLVYQKGSADLTSGVSFTLAWTDRNGKVLAKLPNPGTDMGDIALSPDQKKIAYMVRSGESDRNIWIYDVARQLKSKFTLDSGIESFPIWSPDSAHIIVNSNKSGFFDIYRKPVDFVGTEEGLWVSKGSKVPTSVSSDGKFLLVNTYSETGKGGVHIWTLPLLPAQPGAPLKPFAFLDTGSYDEVDGQFSPNGNWVAFTSTRSGRSEVYVTRFRDAGRQQLVSNDGGEKPRWNPNGNGIFYIEGGTLKEVEVVNKGDTLEIGQTRTVIGGIINSRGYLYDVGKDGRILVRTLTSASEKTRPQPAPEPITLVTNWPGLLP